MNKPRETALLRAAGLPATILEDPDPERALEAILDSAIELTDAERGYIVVVDPSDELVVKAIRYFGKRAVPKEERAFSTTLVRRALEEGKTINLRHAGRDPRTAAAKSVKLLPVRSALVVPLLPGGVRFGALVVEDRRREGAFEEEHVRLVEVVAASATLALRTKQLADRLAERLEVAETDLARLERGRLRARTAGRLRREFPELVGASSAFLGLLLTLEKVCESDLPVLIQGESGTGKELIARAIHTYGPRPQGPFAALNVPELPDTLLESELFGHTRGAFTNAHEDALGVIRGAEGGTLLLDEIGDMSQRVQVKLLRFLQEGEVRPLGATKAVKVSVRILAATNKDLRAEVAAGRFREDLYYRLNKIPVDVPPLRARRGDPVLLARHFLERGVPGKKTTKRRTLSAEAVARIEEHDWPGNVRELENTIVKVVTLGEGPVLAHELGLQARGAKATGLEAVEREAIVKALASAATKAEAARALGIDRVTLWKKIKKYEIEVPRAE